MLFETNKHTYNRNGKGYKSVSKLIKEYKKPFPQDIIAKAIEKRDGTPAQDTKDKWDMNGDISRDFGNAIDKAIEYWIKYGEKPKQLFLKSVVDEFEELTKGLKLHTQIVLYSDKRQIAGTPDLLSSFGNKELDILDVKAVGEMDKKNGGYFLPPFDDIKDTKLNTYRFQLSLYKMMAEEHGYKVNELKLIHFTDKFEIINLTPIKVEKIWM